MIAVSCRVKPFFYVWKVWAFSEEVFRGVKLTGLFCWIRMCYHVRRIGIGQGSEWSVIYCARLELSLKWQHYAYLLYRLLALSSLYNYSVPWPLLWSIRDPPWPSGYDAGWCLRWIPKRVSIRSLYTCAALCMAYRVLLQLKDPWQLFVKRKGFLPGSGFL